MNAQSNIQATVERLVQAALKAVDPAAAVRQAVRREGSVLAAVNQETL